MTAVANQEEPTSAKMLQLTGRDVTPQKYGLRFTTELNQHPCDIM